MRRDALILYRLWFVSLAPAAYFGDSRMLKLGYWDSSNKRHRLHPRQAPGAVAVGLAR
jgi:hypothetical protein